MRGSLLLSPLITHVYLQNGVLSLFVSAVYFELTAHQTIQTIKQIIGSLSIDTSGLADELVAL